MGYVPFELHGKVALVTGGTTGLGLAMATALADAGADVCVWGRDRARNRAATAALRRGGGRALAVACDVADEAAVERAFTETLEAFGRVDACFANAGTDGLAASFVELSLAEWRRVVAVNTDGAFLTLRAAARHMIARGGGGSLVVTSSIAAISGRPGREHYTASKGALLSLVRSLAVELGRFGIRANALLPGPIETEMAAKAPDRERIRRRVVERVPLGRPGAPHELGGIAVYLASDASSYHTGDMLVVDGGYTAA
jgi:NAD(P)-dependent dehydrogenase (short-subunit alcohol dehydrogenase family)